MAENLQGDNFGTFLPYPGVLLNQFSQYKGKNPENQSEQNENTSFPIQQNGTHSTTTSTDQEGANDSTYVSPITPFDPTSTIYNYRADPKKYENEINKVQLPKDGEFAYVIPRNHKASNLPKVNYENKKGFLDDFENVWIKGPCHQHGSSDPFEWDVQLSPKGKNLLKDYIGNADYANVSINGKIRKSK